MQNLERQTLLIHSVRNSSVLKVLPFLTPGNSALDLLSLLYDDVQTNGLKFSHFSPFQNDTVFPRTFPCYKRVGVAHWNGLGL